MSERKRFEKVAIKIAERNAVNIGRNGYVDKPKSNLIAGAHSLFHGEWKAAKEELIAGAGGELKRNQASGALEGHFLAAYSSSALLVNNFLPWKRHGILRNIVFEGEAGFESAMFEKEQPTGLKGTPPHLDLVLENEKTIIAFESKFLEPLEPTTPSGEEFFPRSYFTLKYLPKGWKEQMDLYNKKNSLDFNAPQIIKHALGLINRNQPENRKKNPEKQITLLYLYWVPENIDEYLKDGDHAYSKHNEQLRKFETDFNGQGEITFKSLTYHKLWDDLNDIFKGNEFMILKEYCEKVKARYRFSVPVAK